MTDLNELAYCIHQANRRWWYDDQGRPILRNKGELLMLAVTEIAEAMEGERKNLMDDKLPHRRMGEVELADAIIRTLDFAGAYGYDIQGAVSEKMAYNVKREGHKKETRQLAVENPLNQYAMFGSTSLEKSAGPMTTGRWQSKVPNLSAVSGILPDPPAKLAQRDTYIADPACEVEHDCDNCSCALAYRQPNGERVCANCGRRS